MAKKRATDNQINKIIPVDSNKTYGIEIDPDRLTVILWTRKLYEEDTQVPMRFDKGGTGFKFYSKGDFGPWVESSRPYQKDLEAALLWSLEFIAQDDVEARSNINNIVKTIQDTKKELVDLFKSIKSEQDKRTAEAALKSKEEVIGGSEGST